MPTKKNSALAANASKVSVLIPTKNGEDTLAGVMAMLSSQNIDIEEILIVDSGSQDRTVEIAKHYGATIFTVPPDTFDHGGTRNYIMEKAQGDILVFLTQDAVPKTRDAIGKLIRPLLEDDLVASCYGRQLPASGASHFAESLRKFNYPETGYVRSLEDKNIFGLKTVFTSNSFACYRRSSLEKVGFFPDNVIFGEDTLTVARMLERGEKIAYVPDAVVYHSHNYTVFEEFKRYFDIGVLHSAERWFIDLYGRAMGQGKKYIRHELAELVDRKKIHLLPELLCRVALKYLAYNLGRNYRRLPECVVVRCSMHRSWWNKE